MTIKEIESACDRSESLDFSRHPLEAPDLSLRRMFYPMGFPTEIRTNSEEILAEADKSWGIFTKVFNTEAIHINIHVIEDGSTECPPAPEARFLWPLLVSVANASNYQISDLSQNITRIVLSSAALCHKPYLHYFFLDYAGSCHYETRYITPVHAGCVAFEGRGVLLCGDSGAGKSTLSYACARAGWAYISDDATFLLNGCDERTVTGNWHLVRFRPSAGELFPEIAGLQVTPRAAGKPSIELSTLNMTHMTCAQSAKVHFIVFLNRGTGSAAELRPYRRGVARHYLRQVLFGSRASLTKQYEAIERLLTAEVFELLYSDLDWAVDRLRMLVREGR